MNQVQRLFESATAQIHDLERERDKYIMTSNQEKELQETVSELESQLQEKNKVR